jgi:2-polyprenyl-3-methyl-5-hydroxy-6-metoxy-1,4-benzoquinol methylase
MNNSAESHLDFYRRWSGHCKPYFRWQMRQFSPYIGNRVGDVGCGLGNFAELLLDRELYLIKPPFGMSLVAVLRKR